MDAAGVGIAELRNKHDKAQVSNDICQKERHQVQRNVVVASVIVMVISVRTVAITMQRCAVTTN